MDESNLGEDPRSIREWLESRGGGRSKLPTVLVDTLENHLLNTLGLVSAQQVMDLGDGALLDVYEPITGEDDMDPIMSKLIVRLALLVQRCFSHVSWLSLLVVLKDATLRHAVER